ncbi:hypothetical protein COP2_010298 [Malus domestica]
MTWASWTDTTSASLCGKSMSSASCSMKPTMGLGWVLTAWTYETSRACWIFLFLGAVGGPQVLEFSGDVIDPNCLGYRLFVSICVSSKIRSWLV